MRKTLKRDMLLVMGDFNARIGNDVDAWRGTIGMFGPGELNEKGVKLLDFCAFNNLVVTNTLFQHRPCHQQTWFHPADSTGLGHMLDYVLVNYCFRSSVLDTRVYTNTYLQSDHRMEVTVRAKIPDVQEVTGRGSCAEVCKGDEGRTRVLLDW